MLRYTPRLHSSRLAVSPSAAVAIKATGGERILWIGNSSLDGNRAALEDAAHAVRQHAVRLATWVFACIAFSAILAHASQPQFVATAQILLQPQFIDADGPEIIRRLHQVDLDNNQAQTQLRLIQSNRLLNAVFQALDLAAMPELSLARDSPLTRFLRWCRGWQRTERPSADTDRAFDRFVERVRARRLALSYVIEIAYRSQDPVLAARVTNAIVSAYLRDRIGTVAADLKVGRPYLKSRFDAIIGQELLATDAMNSGSVPARELADADTRILGNAVPPLRPISPHPPLAMALAAMLGLVSGLMTIAIGARTQETVRSRQHLQARLGIDCIGVLASGGLGGLVGSNAMRATLQSVNAVLAARGLVNRWSTIGVIGATASRTKAPLAGPLVEFMLAANLPAVLVEANGVGTGEDRSGMAIFDLPPVAVSRQAPSLLASLDGVILVVEIGATTLGEVRVALQVIKAASLIGVVLAQAEGPRFSLS